MNRLLFWLLVLSPVITQAESNDTFSVLGLGNVNCREYVEDYHSPRHREYINWTSGFISGLNHERKQSVSLNKGVASRMLWLLNYCEENPEDFFFLANSKLYSDLEARER